MTKPLKSEVVLAHPSLGVILSGERPSQLQQILRFNLKLNILQLLVDQHISQPMFLSLSPCLQ